jgi:hypothetical protein
MSIELEEFVRKYLWWDIIIFVLSGPFFIGQVPKLRFEPGCSPNTKQEEPIVISNYE